MSFQTESTQKATIKSVGTRLLSELGVRGLTAAMGLFGRSTPAEALYHVRCCNLIYPPYGNYTYCARNAWYTWYCYDGYMQCTCCECPGCSDLTCYY